MRLMGISTANIILYTFSSNLSWTLKSLINQQSKLEIITKKKLRLSFFIFAVLFYVIQVVGGTRQKEEAYLIENIYIFMPINHRRFNTKKNKTKEK